MIDNRKNSDIILNKSLDSLVHNLLRLCLGGQHNKDMYFDDKTYSLSNDNNLVFL